MDISSVWLERFTWAEEVAGSNPAYPTVYKHVNNRLRLTARRNNYGTEKNVFEETVKSLTKDAMELQVKLSKLQEKNDYRGAIDIMRLLKDTLALIKEYDWHFEYSKYKTDGKKQISVWEQNHCGDIKNHKVWNVVGINDNFKNLWYLKFKAEIELGLSSVVSGSNKFRGTGKSYSLSKLCDEYNGIVVSENRIPSGILNNDNILGINNTVIGYRETSNRQFKDKIIFIDENSGLSDAQIEKLKESHIVIGFM